MNKFLRQINLIEDFSISLKSDKNSFVRILRNNVDESDIDSIFSGAFESFSSSKNEFKGLVDYNGFKIRKRRKFFDKKFGFAKATGKYRMKDDTLEITCEINAWNNFMYIFLGFTFFIYAFFFYMIVFNTDFENDFGLVIFPFVIIHAIFMVGIPYLAMRSGVKNLRRDLEREFHFIVSKNNNK